MSSDIVQKGHPALRTVSVPVPDSLFGTSELTTIVNDMHETLATQHDGVALAAPQIAINYRIFVVAPKAYRTYTPEKPLVFINPVIIKVSKTKAWRDEGCLSVRWWYGKTHRHNQATVEAYNERGEKFQLGGSGLMAQIFQHEIDHLDGILFDDHATHLQEFLPEK